MKPSTVLLIGIVLLAAFFRLQNINWDSNFHLHPDERFLTMVSTAMKIPVNIFEYFNPDTSPFNPINIGYKFFVYGIFPLTINKLFAILYGNDSYNLLTLQGRFLSALFDMCILFFIYKTCLLFEKKEKISPSLKYWTTFCYATMVYPIQASHFFTTDTFLTFFLFTSFYYAIKYCYDRAVKDVIFSGLFFGMGLASKISAIYMIPLILIILCINTLINKKYYLLIIIPILFTVAAYVSVRLFNPYYFKSDDFLNVLLSDNFIENIASLKSMSDGKVWFPPAVQWYSKPSIFYSLFNLIFVGLGIVHTLFVILGIKAIIVRKKKSLLFSLIALTVVFWVSGYFLYTSIQFAKSIRYLIFIFPFLALCAGWGIEIITRKKHKVFIGSVISILLIWPLFFTTIYLFRNTRVDASFWIYNNAPASSIIATEYWDDPLPLQVDTSGQKTFDIIQVAVFDPDNKEKWDRVTKQLKSVDYYILSSNRAWASIPTVPDKYPQMSDFYKNLFDGKTDFKLAAKFIPWYQSLLPFHPSSWINNWLEETFTVYDHPSVFIFKKK